jgi:hypothetical protein
MARTAMAVFGGTPLPVDRPRDPGHLARALDVPLAGHGSRTH